MPWDPAFQAFHGDLITRDHVIKFLRVCLKKVGLDSSLFSGHSFRRGGAQSLADAGVSDEILKVVGRWRSDAFRLYRTIPSSRLISLSRLMVRR